MDKEQIQELREDLQEQLQNCDSGLDERSWGYEEGILLTKRSAQYLLSLIEASEQTENLLKEWHPMTINDICRALKTYMEISSISTDVITELLEKINSSEEK